MKTLEEVQNELANDDYESDWNELSLIEQWSLSDDVAKRYATEAIKADRERIKKKFDDCEYADHVIDGIDNLPIELK